MIRNLCLVLCVFVAACSSPEELALEKLSSLISEADSAGNPKQALEKYTQALAVRNEILLDHSSSRIATNLIAFDDSHPFSQENLQTNIDLKTQEVCTLHLERSCLGYVLRKATAAIADLSKDKRWRDNNRFERKVNMFAYQAVDLGYSLGLFDEAAFFAQKIRDAEDRAKRLTRVSARRNYTQKSFEAAMDYVAGLNGVALEEARLWAFYDLSFDEPDQYRRFVTRFGHHKGFNEEEAARIRREIAWHDQLENMDASQINDDFLAKIPPTHAISAVFRTDQERGNRIIDLMSRKKGLPEEAIKRLIQLIIDRGDSEHVTILLPQVGDGVLSKRYLAAAHVLAGDLDFARKLLDDKTALGYDLELVHKALVDAGETDMAARFLGAIKDKLTKTRQRLSKPNYGGRYYICALVDEGEAEQAFRALDKFGDQAEAVEVVARCFLNEAMNSASQDDIARYWQRTFHGLLALEPLDQLKAVTSYELQFLPWPEDA